VFAISGSTILHHTRGVVFQGSLPIAAKFLCLFNRGHLRGQPGNNFGGI
jgi:hypothetical protein